MEYLQHKTMSTRLGHCEPCLQLGHRHMISSGAHTAQTQTLQHDPGDKIKIVILTTGLTLCIFSISL